MDEARCGIPLVMSNKCIVIIQYNVHSLKDFIGLVKKTSHDKYRVEATSRRSNTDASRYSKSVYNQYKYHIIKI